MKKIIYLVTLLMSTIAFSQVGIGTTTPSPKSILDLTTTTKGFLLPRLTTGEREAINPTNTIDKGLSVFDTDTSSIWFWDGTKWIKTLNTTNVGDTAWGLTGNSGTNPPTNYLGTADAKDFLIKANNTELIRATSAGNVGINTSTPNANSIMDFNGTVVGSKAIKLPYMSTATRDALGLTAPNVLPGMQMFNISTECLETFVSSAKGWYNPCNNSFSNIPIGSISGFNCAGITRNPVSGGYFTNISVNGLGYTITIPYTGGNGGIYSTQSFYSSGVTGLVATLESGTLSVGGGSLVLKVGGTPSAVGGANFTFNIFGQTCPSPYTITVASGGTITGALTATFNSITPSAGSPLSDKAFAGYPISVGSATLTYGANDGGPYLVNSWTSTGVLGLTASIETAGVLNSAGGTIPVKITGTPDKAGTASFSVTVGGKTATLTVPVTAYVSCNDYKTQNVAKGFSGGLDGVYKIVPGPELPTTGTLIDCQCDMTTDGGGWTMVLNYLHQGGTDPARSAQTSKLPLLGETTLGKDESSSATYWGHAAPSLVSLFSFTTVRFYGKTSAHSRIIHFKTTAPTVISCFKGSGIITPGEIAQVGGYTTLLTGHNAALPGTSNQPGYSGTGNNAMTQFPFMQDGAAHWNIGGRWEVDDFPNSSANSTYHAIWVK